MTNDHIFVHKDSRTYFGVQFGGWYWVFNTIPFGFKTSAYIYHTTGLVATSYCRKLGVPCLQYIDDRLISEFSCSTSPTRVFNAYKSLFIVCELLVRIGYFIGLKKSVFEPNQVLLFLGMLIDSVKQAFVLLEKKRRSFAILRNFILAREVVSLRTLQRFTGKCVSFMLAVPAARLFIREANLAIGRSIKNSRSIPIMGKLKDEILHWAFLDEWEGFVPWRSEKHMQVTMATDASSYRWSAVVEHEEILGDLFESNDKRPIHLKEGDALFKTMLSLHERLANHRVDVFVDNQAVVAAWEGMGCRCSELNDIMKSIFEICKKENVDLHLCYISTSQNPADFGSRTLNLQDCKLSLKTWELIQNRFGPHTVDLMALDSNVMCDSEGTPLKHFTPYPCPSLSKVNVFAQNLTLEVNPYVFPLFVYCLLFCNFWLSRGQKPARWYFQNFHPCLLGGLNFGHLLRTT